DYKGRQLNLATMRGRSPQHWRTAARNLLVGHRTSRSGTDPNHFIIPPTRHSASTASAAAAATTCAGRTCMPLVSSAYLVDFFRLLKTLRMMRDFLALTTVALKRSKSVISALAACLASFWPQDDALNLATTSASARAFLRSFFGAWRLISTL
ncbi:hypothetical protein Vretifemale_5806, partial [Volvox reticuliferus]